MKSNESIQDIQNIELEMFSAFCEVCDILGIKYYLLGGSILGAIRHKGFIPWDDDIDIGLFRKDYELFIEKAQSLLPNYYFVQNYKTDPECLIGYTKLRDSRTTFIETSYKNQNMNHGIFIDIFPLDYYPEKQSEQKILQIKNKTLGYRIYGEFYIPKYSDSLLIKNVIKKLASIGLKILFPNTTNVLKQRDELIKTIPKSKFISNYYGAYGEKETVPIEWFGEGIECSFEDRLVSIPSQYDSYLKQLYNDYWKLPPLDLREPHHYVEMIDVNSSYSNYSHLYGKGNKNV